MTDIDALIALINGLAATVEERKQAADALATLQARLAATEAERDTAREYAKEVRLREKAAGDARVSAVDRLAKAEAQNAKLLEALQSIIANTEPGAIRHIAYGGMTAYEALAKDICDCASAAIAAAQGEP